MAKNEDQEAERIAEIVASPQRTNDFLPPAVRLAPVKISPAEIRANLALVMPRLAAYAAYDGERGPWELWLSCAGKAPAKAIAALHEDEAFWFAAWCFANGHAELGLVGYERVLASKADASAGSASAPTLNRFRTFDYVLEAMQLGEHERARRAFAPARAACGSTPADDVLFATLEVLGGELDGAALRKVVARFARSNDLVAQAARAVALDVLGDAAGAHEVLASIAERTSSPAGIGRVLRRRFGDAFTAAAATPRRSAPAKVSRLVGLVAKPSKKATPHVFAPRAAAGPPCRGCGRPLRTWFSFELASVPGLSARLPRRKRLDAPACFDCDAWMVRHDFRVGPRAAIVLEDVEPLAKALATPRSDHSTRAIEPGFVRFVKAPRDLAERPLDGELQLGGDPAWIQEPVAMTCAGCAKEMVFVFRLAAPNDFEECPEPAGGSGAVYFFACPDAKCARFSSVAQWS